MPKTTLWWNLDVLFPPLKYYSLNHPWYLVAIGKFTRQIVIEVVALTTIKNRIVIPTNLLRDKESYIVATVEMEDLY